MLSLRAIEGVHGIRPLVTFDVMSNSPCVSQGNTRAVFQNQLKVITMAMENRGRQSNEPVRAQSKYM